MDYLQYLKHQKKNLKKENVVLNLVINGLPSIQSEIQSILGFDLKF